MKKMFSQKSMDSSHDKFNMPIELRVRIVKIVEHLVEKVVLKDYPGFLSTSLPPKDDFYKRVHDALCYEFGQFNLGGIDTGAEEDIFDFLMTAADSDSQKVLIVIEYLFQFAYKDILKYEVMRAGRNEYYTSENYYVELLFNELVSKLNRNFTENNIGYQYESGQMIRVDSQFTHHEIIKPVLNILSDPMYEGANQEFRSACKHYEAGEYKASLNECLKAFESCMKSICQKRKWIYNQTDAAKTLIKILFDEKLFPAYMQSQFGGVRSILESGIPTMRNKASGHGQGPSVVELRKEMGQYALNLTASNIILLANLERNTR